MPLTEPLTPPTVLLVEDSPDDAMVVNMTFEAVGMHNPVTVLENGEQAIDYLCGQGPYADRSKAPLPLLVILDLNLPRFNGFDVLAATRGVREMHDIPVVVLSASDADSDRQRALEAGAHSVLTKPIDPRLLLKLISEVTSLGLLLVRAPAA